MTEITGQTISQMVDAIVDTIQPEKVVLFGSRAKGSSSSDSDFDFLIVDSKPFGPVRSRRKEMARISKALRKFTVPVDILLYTEAEVESRMNSINNVASRAIREGRVLYERR